LSSSFWRADLAEEKGQSTMVSPITSTRSQEKTPRSDFDKSMPILYEDDEERDLGESNPHVVSEEIFRHGVKAHLAGQPGYQVFSNMNLYYDPAEPEAYVSPDTMVVTPFTELPEDISSYRIGKEGPAPVLTAEVLSERSAKQQDLAAKVEIYARLAIKEYILIDVTGRFLPQHLLLKRFQANGTWKDEQDADGGVTSELGFRVIIDRDGRLRVLDIASGKRYVRPDEAQAEADARRQAEERIRELEEKLARLQQRPLDGKTPENE
jgi:Uma2 family endonuclease